MPDEFDFTELERLAENLKEAENGINPFLKRFLLEQAQRTIAKVKPRTPVDTGALREMWSIGSQNIVLREGRKRKDGSYMYIDPEKSTVADIKVIGSSVEVTIFNNMDYASFVEYGARNVNGTWREGRFMLTISIDEIQQQIPLRFAKAWKEFLISKGAV